jgi:hypothetical protein
MQADPFLAHASVIVLPLTSDPQDAELFRIDAAFAGHWSADPFADHS